MSGAERSLVDLLAGLDWEVNVRLACPSDGPLADAARRHGVSVDEIPETDGSLRLGWSDTAMAIRRLAVGAIRTARHARRMRADVIYANTIRAGLIAAPVARLTSIPAVVHVRDRLPRSPVADAALRLIGASAHIIVANSKYTAEGVRAVTERGQLRVVYNPVDLSRFNPSRVDRDACRAEMGIAREACVLAVIGQITPWKGQHEAVGALGHLRRMGRDVHLLLVGEPKFIAPATRYDNRAYFEELERLIRAEGVADRVHLLGERSDVPMIVGSLDMLLVPSWEEPFGRTVIEAMALGVPVVATNVGGPAEIISDGIDGTLLAPRDPQRWATEVARLMDSPETRARQGDAAARRATDFAAPKHVQAMVEIFEEAARSRA
jgi:L-malate glycosyltransferase